MKFRDLSLKLFSNSWGNSYIPCLLLTIKLRFNCGESIIWSNIKKSSNIWLILSVKFNFSFYAIISNFWIVKKSHILARIYFIFLKNALDQTWKAFNIKLGPQLKDRKSSYQVTPILEIFCNLVNLSL